MNNKLINEIIAEVKTVDDKVSFISKIENEIDDIFFNNLSKTKAISSLLKPYTFSYESLLENDKDITPEIYSMINELKLSISENRYDTGSFYTNKSLINSVLSHTDSFEKTVFDPASGTGNFLISTVLLQQDSFSNKTAMLNYISKFIFSNELLSSSTDIYIKRIQLLFINKFGNKNKKNILETSDLARIRKNCSNSDFLLAYKNDMRFDIIIGNPPYLGAKSVGKEYLGKLKVEFGFSDDLYGLFVFKSSTLLNKKHFFSFVTSSTYFTLKTKKYVRTALLKAGLYKVVANHKKNFNIFTKTATFFCDTEKFNNQVSVEVEQDDGSSIKTNIITTTQGKDFKISISNHDETNIGRDIEMVSDLYVRYSNEVSTSKKMFAFSKTDEFKQMVKSNDILPLGLIAFIATGVDFKGHNSTTLFSLDGKKYNTIQNISEIQTVLNNKDFTQGLGQSGKKYIKAIKGTELLYVRWDKPYFDFLKNEKAPLRNLSLYGHPSLYCKTSTYEFTKVDKNTLCINTAGACFIRPIINISLDEILSQIEGDSVKEYIKNHINNSLCLTPNDLKTLPIRIKK